MAEHLSKFSAGLTIGLLCASVCARALAAPVDLPDPTRPPASLSTQPNDAEVSAAGPELQSVLISSHRREAIVSGRTVRVGDRVGDAKVAKITESEVVLRNGQDMRVLKLFPQIEKRMVREHTGTPARTVAK